MGEDAAVRSMWLDAAAGLGAEARPLSAVFLEVELGGVTTRIRDRMTTPFTDRVADALASDKPLAYSVLARAGVPIPEHVVVRAGDRRAAQTFLLSGPHPVLVKPASGGGGVGIIGNIQTPGQLDRALADAGRYHDTLLVERQAEGDSYRLLFLDGELLDVLRKQRPVVVSDGVSTVEALLFAEQERRLDAGGDLAGYPGLSVDADTLFALDAAGASLRTVLGAGTQVVVKSAANFGGCELTTTVAPSEAMGIVEPGRAAAAALGVRLAGVDVVTTDPQRPLAEVGFVIEVNPVPGLLQHAHVADPDRATPVATVVLAALLGARRPESSDGSAFAFRRGGAVAGIRG